MAGVAAYHIGAGVLGAIMMAVIVGIVALAAGQIAFAMVRTAIALVFAMPAAVAGYHAALDLAQLALPSIAWREDFPL